MADIKRFNNIVEVIKHLEPNHILGECLDKDGVAVKHPTFEWTAMPDGRIAALSMGWKCTFYRGENKCYPSCKASLYRIKERDDRIIALLKSYDFMIFLKSLPEVQRFINENRYYVPWALAQHYEFATPMLDLTDEIAVAAFFATHYYDGVSKQFLLMKEGVGRILGTVFIMDSAINGPLLPIGMQPFARPDRQDGFGYWIPEDEDFMKHSFCVEFVQDPAVNLRLKNAMIGGADYFFPNEQLAQMASIIKNTNAVTSMATEAMIKDIAEGTSYINPIVTREEINRVIKERNVFVVDAPVTCPEAMPHVPNAFMDEGRLIVRPAYRKE